MQLQVHSVLLLLQDSMPEMAVIAFLSSPCFSRCFTGVCNVGSCWCEHVGLLFSFVKAAVVGSGAWHMCT